MKKKTIKAISIVLVCSILIGCSGIGIKNSKSEVAMSKELISQDIELNDRQLEILQLEGFPQDYNSLNDEQKEAIIKIDMLLNYLEDKYNEEFVYDNYYTDYEGTLVARAMEDGKCRQFQACLNWDPDKGEYYCTDVYYLKVLASDKYEELLLQYISENYPEVKCFTDIEVMKYDEAEGEVSNKNACASVNLIINDCFENKEDYEAFLNDLLGWMKNDKYGCALYCPVLTDDVFEEANYYNYTRLMKEKKYKYRFNCDVDASGEIKIEEWD